MGRTLYYEIPYPTADRVTDRQWDAVHALAEQYQRNFIWTCETVDLSPYAFTPRWRSWYSDSHLPEGDADAGWETINREYAKLREQGKGHSATVKVMARKKLVSLLHRKGSPIYTDQNGVSHYPTGVGGFTKVRDNEFNALLVYRFVLDVSRLLPFVRISLHDEGHFLLCSVIIQNGKVQPDVKDLTESLAYCHEQEAKHTGYINSWGREKYEAASAFADWSADKWETPDFFCRRVDPAHFRGHPARDTMSISADAPAVADKLMSGLQEILKEFEGNYYKATGQL